MIICTSGAAGRRGPAAGGISLITGPGAPAGSAAVRPGAGIDILAISAGTALVVTAVYITGSTGGSAGAVRLTGLSVGTAAGTAGIC